MADVIVLFEVKPTKEGMQKYLDLAAMLKPMLAGFEGFIRAERFTSLNEEGKLLSMNVWTDEAAVERWRNVAEHRMSQKEGREKLFESYKITVCRSIRSIRIQSGNRRRKIPTAILGKGSRLCRSATLRRNQSFKFLCPILSHIKNCSFWIWHVPLPLR